VGEVKLNKGRWGKKLKKVYIYEKMGEIKSPNEFRVFRKFLN
jgi:hypothetical protein